MLSRAHNPYQTQPLSLIHIEMCIRDRDGTVLNVSGGTGMGADREHYKNILIAPMAYGQSLTILALIQALDNLN